MWSAYVFISLLCFKPFLGHSQSDLKNVGTQTSENVRQQLAPLDNLGTKIEDDFEKSPVYAVTIKNDMSNGIGGTTVATYDGKTLRTFIINNRTRSICKGIVNGPQCDGTLEPFTITIREDYCYATNYAVINNNICLSSGSVSLTIKNNKFECQSGDGTPSLILSRQEFQNLCSGVTSRHIFFKYYTNSSDPRAIPIPNSNAYVKCLNNEPGVCEFEEDKALPGGSATAKGKNNTISTGSISNSIRNYTSATDKSGGVNGSNKLFQRMEVILFVVTISLLFQY